MYMFLEYKHRKQAPIHAAIAKSERGTSLSNPKLFLDSLARKKHFARNCTATALKLR